jgi:hypothetical protein
MMNKPFKGISVPNIAKPRARYLDGKYPEIGDLVSKELATSNGDGTFRKIMGCIVGINEQYGTRGGSHEKD